MGKCATKKKKKKKKKGEREKESNAHTLTRTRTRTRAHKRTRDSHLACRVLNQLPLKRIGLHKYNQTNGFCSFAGRGHLPHWDRPLPLQTPGALWLGQCLRCHRDASGASLAQWMRRARARVCVFECVCALSRAQCLSNTVLMLLCCPDLFYHHYAS